MSGKSIKEILEKIENERIEKIKKNEEEERRLNSIREKSRKEYLERNRIYENALYNTTTNTPSAGGRGTKAKRKVKSYITTDESYLYPIADLNSALSDPSLYEEKIDNTIIFTDIQQLIDFYSIIYDNSVNSNSGNPYSVGSGTQLKDLESQNIIMRLSDVNETKVIEWKLVKQLTPQSELDLLYETFSPDETEGYITIYSDWDMNGTSDDDKNDVLYYLMNNGFNISGDIDITTILTDGPLVDFDE